MLMYLLSRLAQTSSVGCIFNDYPALECRWRCLQVVQRRLCHVRSARTRCRSEGVRRLSARLGSIGNGRVHFFHQINDSHIHDASGQSRVRVEVFLGSKSPVHELETLRYGSSQRRPGLFYTEGLYFGQ